ncbi:MAG TPA: folate-binding protein [Rhabdaerophilum sp.]|nr:folate-binding protein [Rhabdaerophilum sp.]
MSETSQNSSSRAPLAIFPENRTIIAIGGADAAHFLNNLLTANIETLAPGAGVPAALLTPQGKIIAEMLVFNASDEEPLFLVDVGRGFAEDLVAKLTTYRLRAAVSIDRLGDPATAMVSLDSDGRAEIFGEDFYTFKDPRHPSLGHRLYGPTETLKAIADRLGSAQPAVYHLRRAELGIPEAGQDYIPSDRFPHEVNLDQLGGIDFKKGCYIGQEVVSRMEHRGTARTRTMILTTRNGFGLLGGLDVRAGETLIGKAGESYGSTLLAQLRIDKLSDALESNIDVTAGGVELNIRKPEYAKF